MRRPRSRQPPITAALPWKRSLAVDVQSLGRPLCPRSYLFSSIRSPSFCIAGYFPPSILGLRFRCHFRCLWSGPALPSVVQSDFQSRHPLPWSSRSLRRSASETSRITTFALDSPAGLQSRHTPSARSICGLAAPHLRGIAQLSNTAICAWEALLRLSLLLWQERR
ncbi:hypothetical protein DE146DRAFT_493962 [Phaeosphaeria sp. MPI-PUGE-AT-0046c]|nr:hypothetical protein DE146DRAFT_493962 [Phaeosphaeria sp. MPI-PUGE-AT-0046c]